MKQTLAHSVRIGLVTDIHYGPDRPTRPGTVALDLFESFVKSMNEEFLPSLIVNLGDSVQDANTADDEERLRELQLVFQQLNAPARHVLGNHDARNLSKGLINSILNDQTSKRSFSHHGLTIILLDTLDPMIQGIGGSISDEQLDWLQVTLESSPGPALLFSHHPLDGQDVQANRNFDSIPEFASAVGWNRAQEVISAHESVLAVFSGHVHWSRLEMIRGVPYFSIPALTEAWTPTGIPQRGFAQLTVHEDLTVEVNMIQKASQRHFAVRKGQIQGLSAPAQ